MKLPRAGLGMAVLLPLLTACTHISGAPSVPLFGSFFPAWIICAAGGVVFAVILRAIFIALKLNEHLPAPPLVYLCLSISGSIVIWLFWAGVL